MEAIRDFYELLNRAESRVELSRETVDRMQQLRLTSIPFQEVNVPGSVAHKKELEELSGRTRMLGDQIVAILDHAVGAAKDALIRIQ